MQGTDTFTEEKDLNRLHTALNRAIESEEYSVAATIRDRIAQVTGQTDSEKRDGGWEKGGVPEWLADRARRMGFLLPTQVQSNCLKAINQKVIFGIHKTVSHAMSSRRNSILPAFPRTAARALSRRSTV
jgi:hypothetical protein